MKKTVVITVFAMTQFFSIMSWAEETECTWYNKRDGFEFETISSVKNLKSIPECFHALKRTIVLLEPRRSGNEFEGEVRIKNSAGQILKKCPTATVNGLEQKDQKAFDRFLLDAYRSRDLTGDRVANSPRWQRYFDSKIRLDCKAHSTSTY